MTPRTLLRSLRRRPRPALAITELRSLDEWRRHHPPEARARRAAEERALVPPDGDSFTVDGYCWPCGARRSFRVDFAFGGDAAARAPNWRERLACPRCGLNARQRAALHVFEEVLAPAPGARVYVTEQLSPLFAWLRRRHRGAVGSEFLGDRATPGAVGARGIRDEDVTRLSFADASFDFVLSFDVFEHVPDYPRAFAECARVLRPGGRMLFSVPFLADAEAVSVRSTRAPDGAVTHHLPPEYHGDPVEPEQGVLCWQHFGWAMLGDLRAAGFRDARALAFHSRAFAYLGGENLLFAAGK